MPLVCGILRQGVTGVRFMSVTASRELFLQRDTRPHLSSRWGAGGGRKPHLVPPTWSNRTYLQIIKAKERSEGEGGFGRGRVILPHGDDLRASEVCLRLLRQEEQKAVYGPIYSVRIKCIFVM